MKLNSLGYSTRPTLDNYSCKEIAQVLCLSLSTVCFWVRRGWLKGKKRSPKIYQIRKWHLKKFLLNPPHHLKKRIASLDPQAINYLLGRRAS
ncbi:MAG: hypothetical protein KME21_30360 [Desmonostoc vinosum HA7617-LM4]|nr:hypothetical protein [Desmonostoc vinosum HA7617-LM4]